LLAPRRRFCPRSASGYSNEEIDGVASFLTDNYFLLGEDVSSSPSPEILNAAFANRRIDARYNALNVARSDFERKFHAIKRSGPRGLNITMPYKLKVVRLLDELDEVAAKIRAVNTVLHCEGKFKGFNTDVDGIRFSLRAHGVTQVESVLLLGAGGAARAFCQAASDLGCKYITVAVNRPSTASHFLDDMKRCFSSIFFWSCRIADIQRESFDLVFNATPIGSRGIPLPGSVKDLLHERMIVFDAVYRPMETELIRLAKRRGCRAIMGYEMLFRQAAAAFRIWTGERAPEKLMRRVAIHSLRGDAG
jgi:shikimate dehydrogenase